jgi:signal transduction histidine kinase/CheY-like chemotaxis protein
MRRAFRRYPTPFWAIAGAIIVVALGAPVLPAPDVSLLALFMPAVFLITILCELASCILIGVIFERSHRWELQPLVMLFVANAAFDAAAFVTLRLPGRATPLIANAGGATPWLFAGVHVVLSLGATAFAVARLAPRSLSKAATQRAIRIVFPAWTLVIGIVIGATIVIAQHGALAGGAERTAGLQRVIVFSSEITVSALALIAFAVITSRLPSDWLDLSLILTLLTGIVGLLINAQPGPRYSAPWVTAECLYLCSATFVLIAAIRDLVLRLGDSLRVESDALRLRADSREQNAIVETALVKSKFVAMVSHELRTPLAGILGMAELLGRERLTERETRFTTAIVTAANGLLRIVNDLLDFSRAESGQIALEDRAFDVEDLLDEIVALFREQAQSRGITLNAYVDPALPRRLRGDAMRLTQVLTNLVGNALRFTTEGYVRIEAVQGVDETKPLQLFVSDTGIGIAPHALDSIFDAFVQEDASIARRFGGTGLGLSIAKHLVELMGGRIDVWSTLGVGSTFSVTLPLRSADAADIMPRSLREIAVLVVEPHTEQRALLVRYVEGWEMAVATTEPAHAARALATAGTGTGRPFDVLLVGSGVPDADARALVDEGPAAVPPPIRTIILRGEDSSFATDVPGYDATITLPLRQSALYDAIARLRPAQFTMATVADIQAEPARAPRRERILIAEDSPINQTLLAAQLEHLGFSAELVADGEAAIDAVRRTDYDLIFMDCQMPNVDGFEATRRIRAFDTRNVPIVAVTAHALPGYRETCVAAGMNDYLAKPALIEPLLEIIDRWLPPTPSEARPLP